MHFVCINSFRYSFSFCKKPPLYPDKINSGSDSDFGFWPGSRVPCELNTITSCFMLTTTQQAKVPVTSWLFTVWMVASQWLRSQAHSSLINSLPAVRNIMSSKIGSCIFCLNNTCVVAIVDHVSC